MDLELKTKPEYLESLQWRYATKNLTVPNYLKTT